MPTIGFDAISTLRLTASLEQASHDILAAAIVATARNKGFALVAPKKTLGILRVWSRGRRRKKKDRRTSLQFVQEDERLKEWARRAFWPSALTIFVAVKGRVIAVLMFADDLRREAP